MRRKAGFSLVELMIVMSIILLIAAIAIPNLIRSKIAANESSAVASLKVLNDAELTFASTYGSGFSDTLNRLGAPSSGLPDANNADILDPVLSGRTSGGTDTSFFKSGYQFVYVPTGAFGTISVYNLAADPIRRGSTGQRSFFTDQTAVLHFNTTAPATVADSPI